MPYTPENQKAYLQHTAQKPGLGFPIARVTALISLATGTVTDAALGPYKGKGTGETSLFKNLFGSLKKSDVVVADRHYCSYWLICALMKLGVDVCFRKHQAIRSNRRTPFPLVDTEAASWRVSDACTIDELNVNAALVQPVEK